MVTTSSCCHRNCCSHYRNCCSHYRNCCSLYDYRNRCSPYDYRNCCNRSLELSCKLVLVLSSKLALVLVLSSKLVLVLGSKLVLVLGSKLVLRYRSCCGPRAFWPIVHNRCVAVELGHHSDLRPYLKTFHRRRTCGDGQRSSLVT